jgi:hypothetical protein
VIAGTHPLRKAGEGCRDALCCSWKFACRNSKRAANLQVNRPAALDRTGANFRTAEVLQDGDFTFCTFRSFTHARVRRRVRLVGAMGKVEADDVHTGGNQRVKHGVAVGSRPDRRDDLSLSHVESVSLWARLFLMPSSGTSPD